MNHRNKLTTSGGFRLIRLFSIDHNARRLQRYMHKLGRQPDALRWGKRWKLRNRLRAREAMAAASASLV
jgi:hypothetical protein